MTQGCTFLTKDMPLPTSLFIRMLERLECGSMRVTLPNNDCRVFIGKKPGIAAELFIKNWAAIGKIMQSGDIGVAESYRDGWIDSPDLRNVLLVALANEEALQNAVFGNFFGTVLYRVRHWLNRNTKANSKKNIHAHYDIGNDFYKLWLDPSMTYSAALFSSPDQGLQAAQYAKYDRLLRLVGAKYGDHILEIGCGWGAFAEYAARQYGCKVTGISLSRAQLAWANARIQGTDVADQINFQFCDYRDLKGQYDAIVSIEMVEAVGEDWWPNYFSKLYACLRPGGKAAIQSITIADERFDDYRTGTDFIQQYIFPGGMLPSPQRLFKESLDAGFTLKDYLSFGMDYAETLKRWRYQFETQLTGIMAQGFDEGFIRLWRFYYWYCEAGFLTQRTDVCQLVLAKD